MNTSLVWVLGFSIWIVGCQNPIKKAVRKVEYSAYEMVGVQKRDLLKDRVKEAKEDQAKVSEEFQDALQRLQAAYGKSGSQIERHYDSLKASYDRSQGRANDVHKSIQKVETTAGDLFEEWKKEIDQIETESFKANSRQSLAETKDKFAQLLKTLKTAESRMDPVLRKLKDHLLFMKHNLNAEAIGNLKVEAVRIQNEITALKKDMDRSIEASQQFIDQMEAEKSEN